jgi:ribonucleoside-diphosphate reductase alpha chain
MSPAQVAAKPPFDVFHGSFPQNIFNLRYSWDLKDGGKETWAQMAKRVARHVGGAVEAPKELVERFEKAIAAREFIPGGRYLYATGRPLHQVQNCLLLRADDSREGWATMGHSALMALMTGAGIGINYSLLREEGAKIRKTGGVSSGPLSLMNIINETGRWVMQGGARRSAIWAGLRWDHPDIMKFLHVKDWSPEVRALKAKDPNFPATLDMTNVSVCLNDEFFKAFDNEKHPKHSLAKNVYWETIRQGLKKGEPGFSVDVGDSAGEDLRNACTEVTSKDSDDICNLGSINMSRVRDAEHMKDLVDLGTAFLLAGTVYSDLPYPAVDKVRTKNRRLGLGVMGLHEWLLKHGKRYGPDEDLGALLSIYATSTEVAAKWAKEWSLTPPVKTRAIAPNGTIGIVAETTTGIEPLFCVAYKRRYYKGKVISYEYVVDPVARRLIEQGVKPDAIEDAYSLADNIEQRVRFQSWVQSYVDHGISSTINLPPWGSEHNNDQTVQSFGNMLYKYLPTLRGVTMYPDGARDGQPLNVVSYATAMAHTGKVFEEQADICDISGKGGSCG